MSTRIKFDFEVNFADRGSVRGQSFSLDVPGYEVMEDELARYVAGQFQIDGIAEIRVTNKQILGKPGDVQGAPAKEARATLVDLSHVIENGLITYKGLPAPVICDFLSRHDSRKFYDEGTEFQIGMVEMVTNTGTYIDFPFHRFENGHDLSELGLECMTGLAATVVRVPFGDGLEITEEQFKDSPVKGHAVLVHTGWDRHWNTPLYYEDHPYLTEGAAKYLAEQGAMLVGIDSHNIDSTKGRTRPVHTILLGAEILIVEHLCNLSAVPDQGFEFSAVPPKFKGAGTFPVRAMARIPAIQ
jgi:arylformamidase